MHVEMEKSPSINENENDKDTWNWRSFVLSNYKNTME